MKELGDINNYWPYSLKDYIRMFYLSNNLNKVRILDCYAGGGSFNSELNACGGQVTSISPLYNLHRFELEQYFKENFDRVNARCAEIYNHLVYDMTYITFDLNKNKAFRLFLSDYVFGLREGRYQAEELPFLPYQDCAFDLALLNNFSFDLMNIQEEFIIASLLELCRVAREVRICLDPGKGDKCYLSRRIQKLLNATGVIIEVKETYQNCFLFRLLTNLTPVSILQEMNI